MKQLLTIILIFISPGILSAQNSEIEKVFTKINSAIVSKNIEEITAHYNQLNAPFLAESKNHYENLIELDSLSYELRPNKVSVNGDTAKAIVFEKKSYYKHGRSNTELNWLTFFLAKAEKGWVINEMQDHNYLQAEFVELKMEFDPSERFMFASAKVEFSIVEDGQRNILFLLNRGLSIRKISDGRGVSIPFNRSDLAVEIPWKSDLNKGEKIILNFDYSGNFFNEFEEQGYSLVNIGDEGCFANFVTQWYPKLNGTLTKAKADLHYTVPKDLVVASVGKFVKKEESSSTHTYTYQVNTPMDYTFNANKFFHYRSEVDDIQVNVFFIEGNEEKAKMYTRESMKLVTYLKDLYGVFPYDSYNISEVPPSITKSLGGSGGQGLNFYPTKGLRDDVFEFPLISHEVGHMWWGSWVMSNDASGDMIDEGFSQLNAVLCYRHFYGEKAMWEFLKNGGDLYPQSARSYFARFGSGDNDIPMGIYDESAASIFNQLAYVKSHFVYAMLMEKVGYDTFLKGIRRIITEYANKRFDILNLKRIMEEESSLNLDYFFNQWFYRKGAPEFKMNYSISQLDDGRYEVSGTVKQLRETFQVSAEIGLISNDYQRLKKLEITGIETDFSYILNYKPIAAVFDPDYKILRWTDEFKNLPMVYKAIEQTFTGKNEEAIASFTEVLEQEPYNLTAHTFLGQAYYNIENYELAQIHFQTVTDYFESEGKMSYDVPFSYCGLGKIYEALGQNEKASLYYNKVLQLINVEGTHDKARAFFKKLEDNNKD